MKIYTLRVGFSQDKTTCIKHQFYSVDSAIKFYNELKFGKDDLYFLLIEDDRSNIAAMTGTVIGVKLRNTDNFIFV